MTSPAHDVLLRTLSWADLLVYGLGSVLGLSIGFGDWVIRVFPAEVPIIRVFTVFYCLSSAALVWGTVRFAHHFKFRTRHGLTIGWTSEQYRVPTEVVERLTAHLLEKATGDYGDAAKKALWGALVLFRESTWVQCSGAHLRAIAGEQDGKLIQVGWGEELGRGALVHELAHLILDDCVKPKPSETEAHRLMRKLGWC